jgi:uncharacterized protein YjiS (DUF1127 family)
MTTLTLPNRPRATPRLRALWHAVVEHFAGIRDGLAMAEHYKALSRLSEAELAQRGLTRADIPRVVAKSLLGA